ncbi:restriction system modified-DNA reader domain-containing protein [Cellulomonas biazotea]|uniref:RAMA domain-containing protein n=1 Tax=Cellulomonas biazotea TaxID=1709 RepID=A0A402DP15_9CELL|nr:hypothetical protein [Cellulomonas biazotea]GCE75873.1 hypothetical protein CBZ_09290 [Cellulomonas biazotea]
MPIFELDEGRPRLVQPMQPLAGSFAQECSAVLTHHLSAVAGEPLFAVRWRASAPDHADLPELLALDATGRPVVVEVVQVVDDDAVVAALRHAGAAGRLTTTDLARAYHADPSRFGVDYAAFREQVASGTAASRREGVRLVVLCSEVAAEASDTLGFLRGPGRHVDVLQVGVVRGVDDSRLIDVSPLATHEGARRPVEPTALRLVRSSEAFATAMAYEAERTTPGRRPMTGELRAVTPPPRPTPPAPTPIARRTTVTEPTPLPFGPARETKGDTPKDGRAPGTSGRTNGAPTNLVNPPTQATPATTTTAPAPVTLTPIYGLRTAAEQQLRPRTAAEPPQVAGPRPFIPVSDTPGATATPDRRLPTTAPTTATRDAALAGATRPVDTEAPADTDAPADLDAPTRSTATGASDLGAPTGLAGLRDLLDATGAPTGVVPGGPGGPTRPAPAPYRIDVAREKDAVTAPTSVLDPVARDEALRDVPPAADEPHPELATLAKRRRAVTTLVWVRERRGQRFEALLRSDGFVELPDGTVHADPDAAAAEVIGAEHAVDGWRAWRLGDGGPTLAEATGVERS